MKFQKIQVVEDVVAEEIEIVVVEVVVAIKVVEEIEKKVEEVEEEEMIGEMMEIEEKVVEVMEEEMKAVSVKEKEEMGIIQDLKVEAEDLVIDPIILELVVEDVTEVKYIL